MSTAMFIVQYRATCVKNDKNPIEAAKNEIQEIDLKLKEAEQLRVKRSNLIAFLNDAGDDTFKAKREHIQIEFEDDSEESLLLQKKIIDFLKTEGRSQSVREIINAAGSYDEDYKIIRTIKHLGSKGLLGRDDSPEKKVFLKELN